MRLEAYDLLAIRLEVLSLQAMRLEAYGLLEIRLALHGGIAQHDASLATQATHDLGG